MLRITKKQENKIKEIYNKYGQEHMISDVLANTIVDKYMSESPTNSRNNAIYLTLGSQTICILTDGTSHT